MSNLLMPYRPSGLFPLFPLRFSWGNGWRPRHYWVFPVFPLFPRLFQSVDRSHTSHQLFPRCDRWRTRHCWWSHLSHLFFQCPGKMYSLSRRTYDH